MKLADLAADPLALVKERQRKEAEKRETEQWERDRISDAARALVAQLMPMLGAIDLEPAIPVVVCRSANTVIVVMRNNMRVQYDLSVVRGRDRPPHTYERGALQDVTFAVRAELSAELGKVLKPSQFSVESEEYDGENYIFRIVFPDPNSPS